MREQLAETARSSLLVDPSLLDWSAQLAEALDQLIADLAEGSPARATRGQGERVSEALNELAYRLILAADAAAAGSSGTGVQEALEQLAQLAGQQGELNAQAGGLTPGAVDAALLQQLQTLAARQRAIGEQLSQLQTSLGPQGQVLGRLDQMGREAEELAQQLERGRLNERVLERQERLFHRLLDAGRSLERDELDRERRAERPGEVEILQPGALPADLLRGARFPHPHEETLRRYPATLRRLILEYFDRLNRGEVGGGT